MGIEECVFDHIKKRGIGKVLRMGKACNRCRSASANAEILRKSR